MAIRRSGCEELDVIPRRQGHEEGPALVDVAEGPEDPGRGP
jgi:hypothetical protein